MSEHRESQITSIFPSTLLERAAQSFQRRDRASYTNFFLPDFYPCQYRLAYVRRNGYSLVCYAVQIQEGQGLSGSLPRALSTYIVSLRAHQPGLPNNGRSIFAMLSLSPTLLLQVGWRTNTF